MKKNELLTLLEESREKFLDRLDGIPLEQWTVPGVVGEWSIKDILSHLSRWEAELIKLLWQAHEGQRPTTLQITQTNVDETNDLWFRESRTRSLEHVLEDFHAVRNQTILRVEDFTEKDLTDSKRFSWLASRPLWEWIASDSFEHETEHISQIIEWRKKLGI
jgi:hypothetical protein